MDRKQNRRSGQTCVLEIKIKGGLRMEGLQLALNIRMFLFLFPNSMTLAGQSCGVILAINLKYWSQAGKSCIEDPTSQAAGQAAGTAWTSLPTLF